MLFWYLATQDHIDLELRQLGLDLGEALVAYEGVWRVTDSVVEDDPDLGRLHLPKGEFSTNALGDLEHIATGKSVSDFLAGEKH